MISNQVGGESTQRSAEEQRSMDSRLQQHKGSGRTGGTGPGQGVLSPALETERAVPGKSREAKCLQGEPVGNYAQRADAR